MSNRLNQEREARLQPLRMKTAMDSLKELGFEPRQVSKDQLVFEYKGSKIDYFPYSGWASGKTIKDGRGLKKLLDQLK